MIEWVTQLDFSVLYRIQEALTCPFLDFLMPKITFLGNAGGIWLLTAGILLLFPKYRRADSSFGGACVRRSDRQRRYEKSVCQTAPLLAGYRGEYVDCRAQG